MAQHMKHGGMRIGSSNPEVKPEQETMIGPVIQAQAGWGTVGSWQRKQWVEWPVGKVG